jgi:hypothetical protein
MNNRYGRGLILAITTPKSLKVQGKEIYYVQSETRQGVKYRVNFEDGTSVVLTLQREARPASISTRL